MTIDNNLWVFGYGSLCWHPGFDYGDQVIGHIQGFARKFWQGNTTHRGTEEKVSFQANLFFFKDLLYCGNPRSPISKISSNVSVFKPTESATDLD